MISWNDLSSETRPAHLRFASTGESDASPEITFQRYGSIRTRYSHLANSKDLLTELDASRDRFVTILEDINWDWPDRLANTKTLWSAREITEHVAFSEGVILGITCSAIQLEAPYLITYLPCFGSKEEGIEGIIAMGETCASIYSQISDLDLPKPIKTPFEIEWGQTVWEMLVRNIAHADEHAEVLNGMK
ncbi:MAG TPA: DinB family protein [Dehalococcoidia bacterium]|nr:DinB family protein [Dehalococcoidia bacterium]